MERSWKDVSDLMRKAINLSTSTVSVWLIKDTGGLPDLPCVKMLFDTALYRMITQARYHREDGILRTSVQGMKCIMAGAALGLFQTPQRMVDGELNRVFVKDKEAGKILQDSMYVLGNTGARYGSVLVSPLGMTPVKPGAIVSYVDSAQALRPIIAFAHEKGESAVTEMTGQASVCCAIAKVVDKGQIVIDIPCIGDRAFGLTAENDLIIAFPPSKVE